MENFTQEHLFVREKYGTTKQAENIFKNMDTTTPNDSADHLPNTFVVPE